MFSSTADPIAFLLKSLQPQNKAPLYPFNIAGGQNAIGTIIVAAGLHKDNIDVLKQLYSVGARKAGKSKLILNFVFEDEASVFRPDPSVFEFLQILGGVLQSPRCYCPVVQIDGVVRENLEDSLRVASSCHCSLLLFTQCFGNEILLETVHLHHLLSHSPALCLDLSVPVAMVDYEGLADSFYGTWSVFVRPDELQLVAIRGDVRDEDDFVDAAVEVGLSKTAERAANLLQTLEKF